MFGFVFKKCFEKKLNFFLLFSLFQINIFYVLFFLNILRLGLILSWVQRKHDPSAWVLSLQGPINIFFLFFFLLVSNSLPSLRNLGQEKRTTPKGAWVWLGRKPKSIGSTTPPGPILLVLHQDSISWVLHQDPRLIGHA
jgi:hypothetical protein